MAARLDVDGVVRDWASRGSHLDEPSRRAVVAILEHELNRQGGPARSWTNALYAFNPTLVVSVDDGRLLRSILRTEVAAGRTPEEAAALQERVGTLVDDLVVGAAHRGTDPVVIAPVAAAAAAPVAVPPTVVVPPPAAPVRPGVRVVRPAAAPRVLTRLPGVLAVLAGLALFAALAPLTPRLTNNDERPPSIAAPAVTSTTVGSTTTTAGRAPLGTTTIMTATSTSTTTPTSDTVVATARRRSTTTTLLPRVAPTTTTSAPVPSTTTPRPPLPRPTTTTTPAPASPASPTASGTWIISPIPVALPTTTTTTPSTTTSRPPHPQTTTTTTTAPAAPDSRCPHDDGDQPPGWDNDSGRHRRPPPSCGRPLDSTSGSQRGRSRYA